MANGRGATVTALAALAVAFGSCGNDDDDRPAPRAAPKPVTKQFGDRRFDITFRYPARLTALESQTGRTSDGTAYAAIVSLWSPAVGAVIVRKLNRSVTEPVLSQDLPAIKRQLDAAFVQDGYRVLARARTRTVAQLPLVDYAAVRATQGRVERQIFVYDGTTTYVFACRAEANAGPKPIRRACDMIEDSLRRRT